MDRKVATDISAATLLADADPRTEGYPRDVLRAVQRATAGRWDADESLRAGDLDIDELCSFWARNVPAPWAFYSVKLLEELGYLPKRAIR
jgi:hypothetical protein